MPEVTTTDPTTGEPLATYPASDVDGARSVLAAVHAAQPAWAALPVEARADVVRAIGAQLRKQSDELAGLITAEMGKPVGEARAEVAKSATACDFYAEHGPGSSLPGRSTPGTGAAGSSTSRSAWSWP
jgi:succinate-semialdehyde dehydrogenase / glutarate-semialdehyde dehydrogenase